MRTFPSSSSTRRFAACLLATAFVAAVAGCGAAASPSAPAAVAASGPYSMTATKRCLQRRNFRVTAVPRADPQRRAFRDLAQRISIEASLGSKRVDLAFTRSDNDANVLAELLRPPQGPYVVVVVKNTVVMYRLGEQTTSTRVTRCLR
jgi:type II secretory pathway component HofQ